jgi:hypothetical protein
MRKYYLSACSSGGYHKRRAPICNAILTPGVQTRALIWRSLANFSIAIILAFLGHAARS